MSYAVPPPSKQRPSAVSAASILLWVVVAAQVLSLVLTFIPNEELDRAVDQFNRDHPDLEGSSGFFLIAGILGVGLTLVVGIGLGVLAVFLRRGNQPARIVTWVLGGLLALCQVCGLAGSAVTSGMQPGSTGESADFEELARIIEENTPAWLTAANLALTIISLLALLAAIILLALPVSNDFFRKEAEVWVPPTASPGGGTYPPPPPPAIPQNPMAPPPPPPPPPAQQ